MNKHNCIEWSEEGAGCSICSKSHILNKDRVKEMIEFTNWKINELKSEIELLKGKVAK